MKAKISVSHSPWRADRRWSRNLGSSSSSLCTLITSRRTTTPDHLRRRPSWSSSSLADRSRKTSEYTAEAVAWSSHSPIPPARLSEPEVVLPEPPVLSSETSVSGLSARSVSRAQLWPWKKIEKVRIEGGKWEGWIPCDSREGFGCFGIEIWKLWWWWSMNLPRLLFGSEAEATAVWVRRWLRGSRLGR